MPEVNAALNRIDWPWSISVFERVSVGVVGGVYADIIVTVPDTRLFIVAGTDAPSVIATFAFTVLPA